MVCGYVQGDTKTSPLLTPSPSPSSPPLPPHSLTPLPLLLTPSPPHLPHPITVLTKLQAGQTRVDLSCPWNTRTITDWFLCRYLCHDSSATSWGKRSGEERRGEGREEWGKRRGEERGGEGGVGEEEREEGGKRRGEEREEGGEEERGGEGRRGRRGGRGEGRRGEEREEWEKRRGEEGGKRRGEEREDKEYYYIRYSTGLTVTHSPHIVFSVLCLHGHVHIRLLAHQVEVLMESIQEKCQQLLRVVLCIPNKRGGVSTHLRLGEGGG